MKVDNIAYYTFDLDFSTIIAYDFKELKAYKLEEEDRLKVKNDREHIRVNLTGKYDNMTELETINTLMNQLIETMPCWVAIAGNKRSTKH